MRIDNSAFTKYRFCGLSYFERYEAEVPDVLLSDLRPALDPGNGLQPPEGQLGLLQAIQGPATGGPGRHGLVSRAPAPARDFGTRFHQLVANQRRLLLGWPLADYPEWPEEDIELECRATFAQYEAFYVGDALQPISVERTEHVAIPGTGHELTVRIDCVARFDDGTIGPLDTKTERHGSRSNTREAWVGRTQAALYLWACRQLYPQENVSRMVVDVVTRGSAKFPATFRRMDDITQSIEQQDDAIRNVVQVAEEIAQCRQVGWWPSNRNSCVDPFGKMCEYYPLHVIGRTDANLRLYRPAEDYLANET